MTLRSMFARWNQSVLDDSPTAALAAAAASGDTPAVEQMMQAGADPNLPDRRGHTPLHCAVAGQHAETAACLLAYGADHTIADRQGRTALSLEFTNVESLHSIRQRHRRFRKRGAARPTSERAANWANDLQRDGILRIPGWVEAEELSRIQAGFQRFVSSLDAKLAEGNGHYRHYDEEEHWWGPDRAYVCNNIFKYSAELVRLCCREELVETANHYFGRPTFISRGNAMRYLPDEERTNDMFGWHHDMEEKRFKAMILLTDVGERDQYMSYVRGSHALYHPYAMFFKNECSLEYCRKHLGAIEICNTTGKAGDLFLFDSNGAHRGNRRPDGAVRDAVFVEYTPDSSDIWGGDVPPDAFDGVSLDAGNPFEWMLRVPKKWALQSVRKAPTWVENLPAVGKWLQTVS